jgi:chemotaxis-related protein WspD
MQTHASARLLHRELPEECLRESTANVAAKRNVTAPGTKSAVIFRIGAEWFALATSVFQEIGDRSAIRRLPDRRRGILSGLVNVRGELLLCVALDTVLGLEQSGLEQSGAERKTGTTTCFERLMICKYNNARLAFQVSEVHGLHRYHPADLRNAPATLARAACGIYTLGVMSWRDRTVACLDDELLFYNLNKGLA